MKIKTGIIIISFYCISCFCLNAEVFSVLDDFGTLPSEQTYKEIEQSFQSPELRARPDGGGASLGEVIDPVPEIGYTSLMAIFAAYFLVVYRKKARRQI